MLEALKKTLDAPTIIKINNDSFETLIVTIISQNTSDINTTRAFKNLVENYIIAPKTLANAPIKEIEECLRTSGLYKNKAKTIQLASKTILEKFQGDINRILSLPFEEARKTLMDIRGVGPKTADVVLLFSANQPTIPIDTHVNRVSKRLNLAPKNGNYEDVRLKLQNQFESEEFLNVHLLLIALGRKYCKAHKPLCTTCPLQNYCPSNYIREKT